MKPNPFPRAAHLGKPASRKEDLEQREVCTFLDKLGVLYCAIPNGGKRGKIEAARMKALGTKRGAPDLLIFTPPKITVEWHAELRLRLDSGTRRPTEPLNWMWPETSALVSRGLGQFLVPRGVALEMKRSDATMSDISLDQGAFGRRLMLQGWYWFAARGADEAIAELMRLGFGS